MSGHWCAVLRVRQEGEHAAELGGSHAHPHRRQALCLQGVWQEVLGAQRLAPAHEDPHGGEAVQMRGLRQGLSALTPPQMPLDHSLWQEGIFMLSVRKAVWIQVKPGPPPEVSFQ